MSTRDRTKRKLLYLAALAIVVLGLSNTARACVVCITAPEKTVVDQILDSEAVVLAREDPSKPFSFTPVTVLKGAADGTPIPFLVDSFTRKRLAAAPGDAVLFARARRDGAHPFALTRPEPEWLRLAYADAEYRRLVEQILALEGSWQADDTGRARFSFFEALHDHADPAIRQLALSELARAPYRLIREIASRLTPAEVEGALRDLTMIPWAPVHILLSGRSADPKAHELVRETVRATARDGVQRNLAAWATALVEIDGVRGIDFLALKYTQAPGRSTEELREIVTAFAVHAKDGDASLRPIIISKLHDLVRTRPKLAPEIANHLVSLNDWSQADYLEQLLDSEMPWSPAEVFALNVYVGIARENDLLADPVHAEPVERHPNEAL
jgi:hypothetical protein